MTEYVADRENVWPYGSQREEIVRCRDCKHFVDDEHECERWSGEYHYAEPDGFCAWGDRRDA